MFPLRVPLLLLLFTSKFIFTESACQSCLLPTLPHRHHHHPSRWGTYHPRLAAVVTASSLVVWKNLQKPLVQRSIVVAVAGLFTMTMARKTWESSSEEDQAADGKERDQDDTRNEKAQRPPLTSAMVSTIGVYKNFISPLLPPACRFLPTCSQYGVQAIEEFGPTKGAILTAWRLLRCSPLGGKGYDPPRWPPVKYTYGSY